MVAAVFSIDPDEGAANEAAPEGRDVLTRSLARGLEAAPGGNAA
jgi:hypothetical protein